MNYSFRFQSIPKLVIGLSKQYEQMITEIKEVRTTLLSYSSLRATSYIYYSHHYTLLIIVAIVYPIWAALVDFYIQETQIAIDGNSSNISSLEEIIFSQRTSLDVMEDVVEVSAKLS